MQAPPSPSPSPPQSEQSEDAIHPTLTATHELKITIHEIRDSDGEAIYCVDLNTNDLPKHMDRGLLVKATRKMADRMEESDEDGLEDDAAEHDDANTTRLSDATEGSYDEDEKLTNSTREGTLSGDTVGDMSMADESVIEDDIMVNLSMVDDSMVDISTVDSCVESLPEGHSEHISVLVATKDDNNVSKGPAANEPVNTTETAPADSSVTPPPFYQFHFEKAPSCKLFPDVTDEDKEKMGPLDSKSCVAESPRPRSADAKVTTAEPANIEVQSFEATRRRSKFAKVAIMAKEGLRQGAAIATTGHKGNGALGKDKATEGEQGKGSRLLWGFRRRK
ncbi:hypothetical protein EJ08DRAFT_730789 [Tothia fuscella]|uniref:Uncharacterized protein n=1 Tax=Tothia fuscella TaxID=1048955 RepID=A0A9P4NZN1_9PEZI|nr:hypothetical protein EJ08DRAFT_730789 [Tothia fuscella]